MSIDRNALILIIKKLIDGPKPVERYVLMTQLRSWCGHTRRARRPLLLRWIPESRKAYRSRKRNKHDRIHVHCYACKYELLGLDPIWLEELCVGPDTCPECGCAFPAVGD